ncbi:MAG TPA: hypothetical protein VG054_06400 [Acidimicrobiales bacterium]|jgi:hypothetical protein|nr:hypothetical protein [Acidimicrobiales bacterium]
MVPAGTVKGGHAAAQPPVQVGLPVPSGEYRYRVLPDWSIRITPNAPRAVAATDDAVDFAAVVVVVATLDPQAAATSTTAPSAPPTSHRKWPAATGFD